MREPVLSDKLTRILSSTRWFHATTKSNYKNILSNGIICDYNRYGELDFGFGFYLTTTGKLAESYITRLLSWQGENLNDPPVILEYELSPITWFTGNEYRCAIFPFFDDDFANFVLNNRLNCRDGQQHHNYDAIYGVMSDSTPTVLLLKYRAGEITFEEVIQGLKKENSMKQLSIHNQNLCDTLALVGAYEYNMVNRERKELSVS